MAKYLCKVCGYIYDEAREGVLWEQLPADWKCPLCDSDKSYFQLVEESSVVSSAPLSQPTAPLAPEQLAQKRICSVCGYIIEPGHDPDVCPACGFPKTAFKPYIDKISPKRRKILDLHLHQIIIHFPQAFALFMFFLLGSHFLLTGHWQMAFLVTAKIMSIFLPFAVLAAILSGYIEGTTRFKRVDTPALRAKIVVGILFLGCSIGVFACLSMPPHFFWRVAALAVTGLCCGTVIFLGHNGGRLTGNVVPD